MAEYQPRPQRYIPLRGTRPAIEESAILLDKKLEVYRLATHKDYIGLNERRRQRDIYFGDKIRDPVMRISPEEFRAKQEATVFRHCEKSGFALKDLWPVVERIRAERTKARGSMADDGPYPRYVYKGSP